MDLKLVACDNISLLTVLYKELLEDEQADFTLTDAQLSKKMAAFLESGQQAYVAVADGETVGYMLVVMSRTPLYLHHFYICRDHRRKGYGRAAFSLLLDTLQTRQIDLDVFVWNERGQAFWQSLGFEPRSIIMRYGHGHD